LDWSTSPLVALWFAVSEPANKGEPSVVWAYCYNPSEIYQPAAPENALEKSPFSIDKTLVYFPEHVFPYIQAQSGVFTVHRKHEDRFVPFEETSGSHLTKFEIDPDCVWLIRSQLVRLGISTSSLFPGLTGLVERIKFQNDAPEDEPISDWVYRRDRE